MRMLVLATDVRMPAGLTDGCAVANQAGLIASTEWSPAGGAPHSWLRFG